MRNCTPKTPNFTRSYVFYMCMAEGNKAHGARKIGITPATMAKHIRELEQAMGVKLYDSRHCYQRPTTVALKYFERISPWFDGLMEVLNVSPERPVPPKEKFDPNVLIAGVVR